MSKALLQSVIFHALLVALIFLSSTSLFSRKEKEVEITSITVDLMVAEKTNIRPKPKAIPKKAKPKKKPKPKPTPPKAKPKPKPPEPKPAPPKPKPKKEPKKEPPKKKPKPKPKKKEESELEALLKSLEAEEPEEVEVAQTNIPYDPQSPESISQQQAILGSITNQIRRCWNVPAGARNAAGLQIAVDIDITRDGTVKFVGFTDEGRYYSEQFYQVAADSARRAVLDPRCNPLRDIPPLDKYDIWSELTIIFDPEAQIY